MPIKISCCHTSVDPVLGFRLAPEYLFNQLGLGINGFVVDDGDDIVTNDEVLAGKPIIKDTRLSVELVWNDWPMDGQKRKYWKLKFGFFV